MKKQFTLNEQNNYALHLKAANAQFTPVDPTVMPSALSTTHAHTYTYTGIGLALIGILAIAFLWRRRNDQQLIAVN